MRRCVILCQAGPRWLGAFAVIILAGCGSAQPGVEVEPRPVAAEGPLPEEIEGSAAWVRENPRAYLRQVAEKCRDLEDYTLLFTRHERRGLFKVMHGPEHIRCWFRRSPFSVRMKWLDEDLKYGESVYIEGQHDDKVRFVTRWWSPPLLPPPAINKVSLQTPVTFGESKRPLTDFGLERLMERTLANMEAAGDDVTLTVKPPFHLDEDGPLVHQFHFEYPPGTHATPVQELYVNVATDLPAGTVLKLPSGDIDAAYFYADIDTDVELADEDFLLDVERDQTTQP